MPAPAMKPAILRTVDKHPSPCRPALLDWMETHSRIIGFWLDRLIADGDDGEYATMLHRQQHWLGMMQERLRSEG